MKILKLFVLLGVLVLMGCQNSPKPVSINGNQYKRDHRCVDRMYQTFNGDFVISTSNRGNLKLKRGDMICYSGDVKNNPYVYVLLHPINNVEPKKPSKKSQVALKRIASYETAYTKKYKNILKTIPKYKFTYIQPSNKKEACKLQMSYDGNYKWFEEDSYKVFWDGKCKNGYASGLGREIETADMVDKWGITIYKKGKPTYYVVNNILASTLFEGVDTPNKDYYGVTTTINEELEDINIITNAGNINRKTKVNLVYISSPFWNGRFFYEKQYPNYKYVYQDDSNNDSAKYKSSFFLVDENNVHNGWIFTKDKLDNVATGEILNGKYTNFNMPIKYRQKVEKTINQVHEARRKAFRAQKEAKKVKKQYLKRICKENVKVDFMDNDEYKEICSSKKELVVLSKINAKLRKLTEAKIARLEKERFGDQQQREKRHREELLTIERQRLAEQRRHHMEQESAADTANFNQNMKNITDQINNMTPKTYDVNVYHY